jgi:cell division transport system permease protein
MGAEENKYSSRRLRTSYITSVASIALILFTLGLLGLMLLNAKKLSDYVKEHIQLVVFLNDSITPVEASGMQALLEKSPFVKSAQYVSKESALDSLKKTMGENAVSMIESNPLPASFDISMNARYANADSLASIVSSLNTNPLVREVYFPQNDVAMIFRNLKTIGLVILAFSGLLFIIAFALINNMVRLAVYSKRFLIKSMQLVGATRGFIRRPFLRRGLMNGFYGGLIACAMLAGLIYLAGSQYSELAGLQDNRTLLMLFGGILATGLLLSGISTYFAVRKYLRLTTDELYF